MNLPWARGDKNQGGEVVSTSYRPESRAGEPVGALSLRLTKERWNDGTLLHLPTLQPITSVICFTSALSTPRFQGDRSQWAWPQEGGLIATLDWEQVVASVGRGGLIKGHICIVCGSSRENFSAINWFVMLRCCCGIYQFVNTSLVVEVGPSRGIFELK